MGRREPHPGDGRPAVSRRGRPARPEAPAPTGQHAATAREIIASTLVVNGMDPSELTARYVDMQHEAGVRCWLRGRAEADVHAFATAYRFLDAHADRLVPARTVAEIRAAAGAGRLAHVFGWQSANTLADPPRSGDLTALRAYHELGLRVVGIAYNVANVFGGGCLHAAMPLTRAGHRLVESVHRLRMVLDVGGHTGERTSLDALAMSKGVPVICSHTNVAALMDNPRNTTDRVLEAVAATGGVIGLTAFSDFHARSRADAGVPRTPQAGLDAHLDHFDYLRRLVGAEHIGLGPDFIEGRPPLAPTNPAVSPPEIYSDKPWQYVEGFEDIRGLPNVVAGLLARGWPSSEVAAVLGANWLRVYERVWGA